jgi:hypothetical protein
VAASQISRLGGVRRLGPAVLVAGRKPHAAHAPGDFYVEDGCCTMCSVPFAEARDLFGACQEPEGYFHCDVKRQPDSPTELEQMLGAIRCAEFQCIRYRGADRLIQLRLVEFDGEVICDALPPDLQQEADRREAERQRLW